VTGPGRRVETLPEALDGERLDRVVALLADVSRREAVELIAGGAVSVNGRAPGKPSLRLSSGDEVVVEVPERSTGPGAEPDIAVTVVHEDDEVIVVDKPPHLVVHPGSGVRGGTLVNGLLARYPELAPIGEEDRPGIVHRLDKGTSGLLMVARTPRAHRSLVEQLAARTVTRRYLALVDGLVESDEGLIDAPLGRSARRATRRAVVADGRPARTRYRVERRFPAAGCTLMTCRLETGRTHQIRAHLAAIGHPVVGDALYGGPAPAHLARPFLHAAHLGFEHPVSGRWLSFDSDLPDDLTAVLARLDREGAEPS
jgi:23S rRNA pseudouridine1911/1915/1917 synthase